MKLFCPSCGSPLEFRYDDSFVRVCAACHSAILRTDRGIDTLGKFADLAPSSSGLELGARGQWQGQSFVLEGRAEYRHPAGGSWEEWYIKLADGRWGWLSYAEGRWALTFQTAAPHALPPFEELGLGRSVLFGASADHAGTELRVAECNAADALGAEGEIPFVFVPGTQSRFVDLGDERGHFATIDYGALGASEEPRLFLGRRASFSDLGFPEPKPGEAALPVQAGERLGCPHCGGSIELRLPGSSLAVVCPYCNSLLDCEGPLAILQPPSNGLLPPSPIALGQKATFDAVEYTVTGRMRRASTYSTGRVEWDEYLLHAPAAGYRWLVCVNGHYSFVTELSSVLASSGSELSIRHESRDYRLYDRAEASVVDVRGEFYWKVTLGETVRTCDYVSPPFLLSDERSATEAHCSLGVYQSIDAVREALRLPDLPDERVGVGAHQPFAYRGFRRLAWILGLAWLVTAVALGLLANAREVYREGFTFGDRPAAHEVGSPYSTYVLFSPSFELTPRQNIEVDLSMPLSNSWAFATVDLIDEASGEIRSFDAELSHYFGVEDGESWSEGQSSASMLLSAASGSAGSHQVRVEVQLPTPIFSSLTLSVRQNVFDCRVLLLALALIGAPAIAFAIAEFAFERQRWADSDFAPGQYAGGGSDASGDDEGAGRNDD